MIKLKILLIQKKTENFVAINVFVSINNHILGYIYYLYTDTHTQV